MARGRKTEVDDEEIVAVLRDWPKGDFYPSTGTVQEKLDADYNRKTVYRRLDELESKGRISKVVVGEGRGNAVGWFVEENKINKVQGTSGSDYV